MDKTCLLDYEIESCYFSKENYICENDCTNVFTTLVNEFLADYSKNKIIINNTIFKTKQKTNINFLFINLIKNGKKKTISFSENEVLLLDEFVYKLYKGYYNKLQNLNLTALFLNHKKHKCGVYQYGKRLFDILSTSSNIKFKYYELDSLEEYNNICDENKNISKLIVYNYHVSTMSWLNKSVINKNTINIGIQHESEENLFNYDLNIYDDIVNEKRFNIERPIFEDVEKIYSNHIYANKNVEDFIKYNKKDVPIFGSFGFGFSEKGFDKIVKIINENYEEAIIKLVITLPDFSSDAAFLFEIAKEKCLQNITKKGIKLLITSEFFSDNDLLVFLNSNTANIFLYDSLIHRKGVSSVIDYAMSVDRPILISNSYLFRHVYDKSICVFDTNIKECLLNSKKIRDYFVKKNCHQNLINNFENIINNIFK